MAIVQWERAGAMFDLLAIEARRSARGAWMLAGTGGAILLFLYLRASYVTEGAVLSVHGTLLAGGQLPLAVAAALDLAFWNERDLRSYDIATLAARSALVRRCAALAAASPFALVALLLALAEFWLLRSGDATGSVPVPVWLSIPLLVFVFALSGLIAGVALRNLRLTVSLILLLGATTLALGTSSTAFFGWNLWAGFHGVSADTLAWAQSQSSHLAFLAGLLVTLAATLVVLSQRLRPRGRLVVGGIAALILVLLGAIVPSKPSARAVARVISGAAATRCLHGRQVDACSIAGYESIRREWQAIATKALSVLPPSGERLVIRQYGWTYDAQQVTGRLGTQLTIDPPPSSDVYVGLSWSSDPAGPRRLLTMDVAAWLVGLPTTVQSAWSDSSTGGICQPTPAQGVLALWIAAKADGGIAELVRSESADLRLFGRALVMPSAYVAATKQILDQPVDMVRARVTPSMARLRTGDVTLPLLFGVDLPDSADEGPKPPLCRE